jgi:flagellar biosynthesis/type III secretory pathway chaperone
LGKVASVVSTGLAGIPDKGRPSFISGLGSGARAENAAQAAQQEIKFRTFDDQVRAANLHNQDLQMQQQNEDQQAARQAAVDFQTEAIGKQGGTIDTHPNDGTSVTQTLQAQTAANGAATITPGTHISPNGKDINIPANNPQTMSAQLKNYKDMVGILPGLPSTPNIPDPSSVKNMSDVTNARANMGKAFDIFTHLTNGHNVDGSVYTHQQLNNLIPAYQAQIDSHTAKGDLSEYQMGTLKNTLSILQADEQNHSDAEDEANAKAAAQKAAQAGAVAGAQSQAKLPATIAAQNNAAANKAANAKPSNTDWNPGVGADEKKKAELAENIAYNANEVAKIVMKRPDILGAVAGRYTNAEQMMGNNDPDISALGVHVHNMAMANSGVHGFRSQEGVESYERQLLNNFKNGPAAMAGALRASTGSVQTFIDNARPQSYKTHTNQGGAVKGMTGAQQ